MVLHWPFVHFYATRTIVTQGLPHYTCRASARQHRGHSREDRNPISPWLHVILMIIFLFRTKLFFHLTTFQNWPFVHSHDIHIIVTQGYLHWNMPGFCQVQTHDTTKSWQKTVTKTRTKACTIGMSKFENLDNKQRSRPYISSSNNYMIGRNLDIQNTTDVKTWHHTDGITPRTRLWDGL